MIAARRLRRFARSFRLLTPFGWSCLFAAVYVAAVVVGICLFAGASFAVLALGTLLALAVCLADIIIGAMRR